MIIQKTINTNTILVVMIIMFLALGYLIYDRTTVVVDNKITDSIPDIIELKLQVERNSDNINEVVDFINQAVQNSRTQNGDTE